MTEAKKNAMLEAVRQIKVLAGYNADGRLHALDALDIVANALDIAPRKGQSTRNLAVYVMAKRNLQEGK